MLKDRARNYYLNQDLNCAETLLHSIDDEYGLSLPDETFKAVASFGGGLGCGHICGALAGAAAAIGIMSVQGHAHITPDFRETCGQYVESFKAKLGDTMCSELKEKYKKDDETRCLETVLLACDVFDEYMAGKK